MRQALTSSRSTAVPVTVQAGSLAVAVPRRAAERAFRPARVPAHWTSSAGPVGSTGRAPASTAWACAPSGGLP